MRKPVLWIWYYLFRIRILPMLLKHIWKISKTPYNPSKRVPVPTICHFSISSYVQSYSTTVQNPHACLKFRNTILCICSFILAGSGTNNREKVPNPTGSGSTTLGQTVREFMFSVLTFCLVLRRV